MPHQPMTASHQVASVRTPTASAPRLPPIEPQLLNAELAGSRELVPCRCTCPGCCEELSDNAAKRTHPTLMASAAAPNRCLALRRSPSLCKTLGPPPEARSLSTQHPSGRRCMQDLDIHDAAEPLFMAWYRARGLFFLAALGGGVCVTTAMDELQRIALGCACTAGSVLVAADGWCVSPAWLPA